MNIRIMIALLHNIIKHFSGLANISLLLFIRKKIFVYSKYLKKYVSSLIIFTLNVLVNLDFIIFF